jgi:hypothetical protein
LSVTSFGAGVPLSKLPTTEGQDRRLARRKPAVAPLLDPVDAGELSITVRPGKAIRRISPYVYGLNSQHLGDTGATLRRNGGNRGSGRFGDTAVQASVANRYAARIDLGSGTILSKARTFVLDAHGPDLKPGLELAIQGGVLRHALGPLSAILFELR